MSRAARSSLAVVLAGLLAACGNSGGSKTVTVPPAPTVAPAPATFAGVLAAAASCRNAASGCVTPRRAVKPLAVDPRGEAAAALATALSAASAPVDSSRSTLRRWARVPCRPPAANRCR